jgi:hypothetical protein
LGYQVLREGGGSPRGKHCQLPGQLAVQASSWLKMAPTSREMEDREELLINHALTMKEDGPVGVRSCEELKSYISHHFGLRRQEFYAYHSRLDPFVLIFSERWARDIIFVAGKLIDSGVELHFNTWELDDFGDRVMIPYHIKLNLEGIPSHAWFQDTTYKILGDEAIIHHVEENTMRRADFRAYQC